MVSHPSVVSGGVSDVQIEWLRMGNVDIYMVFLLNVFFGEFLVVRLYKQHMGIEDIYTVAPLNVFLDEFSM